MEEEEEEEEEEEILYSVWYDKTTPMLSTTHYIRILRPQNAAS
jgi:hypothetical protein